MIEDGFLHDHSLADLARDLYITDRHLRRVFKTEFGIPIVEHVQTHRLLIAKQLLTDTSLPITEVALVSGFSSIRRFNASLKERYRLRPSDIRKLKPMGSESFGFELGYRPPYDWGGVLTFLSDRAIDGVEHVENGQYRRSAAIRHKDKLHVGWVKVSLCSDKPALRVDVSRSLSPVIPQVLTRVKRLFDLACDPADIENALHSLNPRPGLRVPGSFDSFEMAVRAILGQQVSVKAAKTLAGRVAACFGDKLTTSDAMITCTFPTADTIAKKSTEDLAALGVTKARASCIIALAKAVTANKVVLAPSASVSHTIAGLRQIPGIGEWTAEYIAMRALSWPDAFPHTDLGLRKALNETSARRVLEKAEAWKPWRSYAVIALWHSLSDKTTKRHD